MEDTTATVHISYRNLHNNLDEVVEDAHYLAFHHEVRADAINTKEFHYDDKNVHGLLFDIKGDAASLLQFWYRLEDTTRECYPLREGYNACIVFNR